MDSSEILLIAVGSGLSALYRPKFGLLAIVCVGLLAIVCVVLLARFRGRVQALIAATTFSLVGLVAIATVHRFSQVFTTNGQFAVVIGAICCCALFAVSSTSDRTSTHSSTNPFEVRLDELSKYVWSRNADGTIEYLSRLRSVNYDCDRGAKWVFDRRTWSARPANTQAPDKVQSLQKNTGNGASSIRPVIAQICDWRTSINHRRIA